MTTLDGRPGPDGRAGADGRPDGKPDALPGAEPRAANAGLPAGAVQVGRPYSGAKIALFFEDRLPVIRRDDFATIPWPDHWDLPGGGREGDETALACALRELQEELSILVAPEEVIFGRHSIGSHGGEVWFFVARLSPARLPELRLGDEGQEWRLMTPEELLAQDKAIPVQQARLADWIAGV